MERARGRRKPSDVFAPCRHTCDCPRTRSPTPALSQGTPHWTRADGARRTGGTPRAPRSARSAAGLQRPAPPAPRGQPRARGVGDAEQGDPPAGPAQPTRGNCRPKLGARPCAVLRHCCRGAGGTRGRRGAGDNASPTGDRARLCLSPKTLPPCAPGQGGRTRRLCDTGERGERQGRAQGGRAGAGGPGAGAATAAPDC